MYLSRVSPYWCQVGQRIGKGGGTDAAVSKPSWKKRKQVRMILHLLRSINHVTEGTSFPNNIRFSQPWSFQIFSLISTLFSLFC